MQSERPKTVVFVESAAAMGGVQFSTLYLAQSLDKGRWKPIVVCPEEGDLINACRESGIETHVLDHPRLWSTSVRVGATRLPNPGAWVWDVGVIVNAARRLKRFLFQCSPGGSRSTLHPLLHGFPAGTVTNTFRPASMIQFPSRRRDDLHRRRGLGFPAPPGGDIVIVSCLMLISIGVTVLHSSEHCTLEFSNTASQRLADRVTL